MFSQPTKEASFSISGRQWAETLPDKIYCFSDKIAVYMYYEITDNVKVHKIVFTYTTVKILSLG